MVNLSRARSFAWVIAGFSLIRGESWALQPTDVLTYSVGPLVLRPQFKLVERFDDNIFYRDRNIESDLITVISPGLNLQLGKDEGNFLKLDYSYDQYLFLDHSAQDTPEQTIRFQAKYDSGKTVLKGLDSVQFLTGILGGGNNLGQNVNRVSQSHNYTVEHTLTGKTSLSAGLAYDATDFDQGTPLYSSEDWRGTVDFTFQAFSKIRLFGEGYYGQTYTPSNSPLLPASPDSEYYGGFLGAKGDFRPRTSGSLKVGYQIRSFTGFPGSDGSPVVELGLSQGIGNRTLINFSYSLRSLVSIQFAKYAYSVDSIGVDVARKFGSSGKWSAFGGAHLDYYSYDKTAVLAARSDVYPRVNLGVNYKIQRWLAASLGYDFEMFSSNAQGIIDYQANRATLSLTVGY